MEDVVIGGWKYLSPRSTRRDSNGDASVNSNITPSLGFPRSTGYPFVCQLSSSMDQNHQTPSSPSLKRSKDLNVWKTLMQPCLQFACGPLLRYDTIEDGVWHGAALIVSECCCFSVGLRAGANTRDMGKLLTLVRRTIRVRLSSVATNPNVLLRTKGNTTLKVQKMSTWSRARQPAPRLYIGGIKQTRSTSRDLMYKERVFSMRRFTCIVDELGEFLRSISPSTWLTWYAGISVSVLNR